MLPVGQILTVVSTKTVYLVSIGLFELGSLICGVAPSSQSPTPFFQTSLLTLW
jgi:hypothetical protein